MSQCPRCAAELTTGATLCRGCTDHTRVELGAIPALLEELDLTLSGQASAREPSGDTCPAGCDHDPDSPTCRQGVTLDLDEGASAARHGLTQTLHGWARVWDEETPVPAGGLRRLRDLVISTPARQARTLAAVPDLGSRTWAAALAVDVDVTVGRARAAIDTPPDRVFLGWCPGRDGAECGRALYAAVNAGTARCPGCSAVWPVEESRTALMAAGGEALAPALDLARALRVPLGTMRRWRHDGWLQPVDDGEGKPLCNAAGQPLYRFRDAQRLAQGNTPGRAS